jgi:hypothetical protein
MTTPGRKKIGRNDKCPCGSGLKYKKCCLRRKDRVRAVSFRPNKSTNKIRLGVSGDGRFWFEGEEGILDITVDSHMLGYKRPKGPKIISQISSEAQLLTFNPDWELKKYDYILAVDTNTRTILGTQTSASAVFAAKFEDSSDAGEAVLSGVFSEYYEFRQMRHSSELIAWWFLIKGILEDPIYDLNKKFAVVVDSHLGEIELMNRGEKPVLGDLYLPQNCRLMYASADVGKEWGINKVMTICDKESTKFLKWLERFYRETSSEISGPKPFFRLWPSDNSQVEEWTSNGEIHVYPGKQIDISIFP